MKRFWSVFILLLFILLMFVSCGNSHLIAPTMALSVAHGAGSDVMLSITPLDEPIPEPTAAPETDPEPIEEPMPTEPDPSAPLVYLTFDDGPSRYTESILETLAEYDVKATFFVVGDNVNYYPKRVQAIANAGHVIGCHSMTHAYRSIYESQESITADLAAWERSIESAIGYVPKERLYRFPGGSNCTAIDDLSVLHQPLSDRGYRCFDWSLGNNDRWLVGKPEDMDTIDYMKESVIKTLALNSDTRIMLLHDTSGDTAEMLGWIIEYLRGEGYEFATLADFDGEFLF